MADPYRARGTRGRHVVGRPPSRHAAAGQADNHTSAWIWQVASAPAHQLLPGWRRFEWSGGSEHPPVGDQVAWPPFGESE